MGAASSLAPSYDLAFKKNRAAASSLPPSARPPRTARKRANGPTFPLKQKARTSSRRASSTPNARKRAPRMTPLQTSSDPEVADWEKPLGGVFQAPTGIGVLPGAGNGDVERRLSRRTMRPRRAPTRGAPTVIGDWKFQRRRSFKEVPHRRASGMIPRETDGRFSILIGLSSVGRDVGWPLNGVGPSGEPVKKLLRSETGGN